MKHDSLMLNKASEVIVCKPFVGNPTDLIKLFLIIEKVILILLLLTATYNIDIIMIILGTGAISS